MSDDKSTEVLRELRELVSEQSDVIESDKQVFKDLRAENERLRGLIPKCRFCAEFFQKYRCNADDECDCPRCSGLCECISGMTNFKTLDEMTVAAREEVWFVMSPALKHDLSIDAPDVVMMMIETWKRGYSAAVEDARAALNPPGEKP